MVEGTNLDHRQSARLLATFWWVLEQKVDTVLEPRTTSLKKAPRAEKGDNIKKFLEFMTEKSFAVKLQQKAI